MKWCRYFLRYAVSFLKLREKAAQRVMPFRPVEYDYIDMQGELKYG